MEFTIITGLSGAGKSRAADVLEDFGYYCVDNMPAAMMPKFAEFCMAAGGKFEKVALVSDVRENGGFDELIKTIDELRAKECNCKILFMNSDIKTLVKRYKETRRKHPLAKRGETLEDAIKREMELSLPIKEKADYIIDSTNQTLSRLQRKLSVIVNGENSNSDFEVNIISFGYKYGIPLDADLVFDVRFLPNPFYVEELREMSGMDDEVSDYVFSYQQTKQFMSKLEDMISYLLPYYIEEGKSSLSIAIGCTGGRHRSVSVANELYKSLASDGLSINIINRDVDK